VGLAPSGGGAHARVTGDGVKVGAEERGIGAVPTEKVMASASLVGPARHRAPRILARTERWKVIRTGVAIKSWIAQTPSVDEVRPARSAGCGAPSRPVGSTLNVHGQG
jgi:hypothetical protein